MATITPKTQLIFLPLSQSNQLNEVKLLYHIKIVSKFLRSLSKNEGFFFCVFKFLL